MASIERINARRERNLSRTNKALLASLAPITAGAIILSCFNTSAATNTAGASLVGGGSLLMMFIFVAWLVTPSRRAFTQAYDIDRDRLENCLDGGATTQEELLPGRQLADVQKGIQKSLQVERNLWILTGILFAPAALGVGLDLLCPTAAGRITGVWFAIIFGSLAFALTMANTFASDPYNPETIDKFIKQDTTSTNSGPTQ